jgi:hypothetical protein
MGSSREKVQRYSCIVKELVDALVFETASVLPTELPIVAKTGQQRGRRAIYSRAMTMGNGAAKFSVIVVLLQDLPQGYGLPNT